MRAVHSLSPHDQEDKKKEKRKKSIGPIGQRIQAAGQGSGGQGRAVEGRARQSSASESGSAFNQH